MKWLVIALIAIVCSFGVGYYLGAKPRTCAYVKVNQGSGIVCANYLNDWTKL